MWVRGLKLTTEDSLSESLWVAPYVGAWIETWQILLSLKSATVAPYVGAWIETFDLHSRSALARSHPMWVRGLKLR